jgi:hypothetical protein
LQLFFGCFKNNPISEEATTNVEKNVAKKFMIKIKGEKIFSLSCKKSLKSGCKFKKNCRLCALFGVIKDSFVKEAI